MKPVFSLSWIILSTIITGFIGTATAAADDLRNADPAKADPVTGIALSPGFSSTVFADKLGQIRHIAVARNGWVYAALRRPVDGNGGVALKDDDGDGLADQIKYFGAGSQGTGIALRGDYLYYGENNRIIRFNIKDTPIPGSEFEIIASGFPNQRAHASKPFTFDQKGFLYVNVGVPSNACMAQSRVKGSIGQSPCPELENHGGIYRFKADTLDQTFSKDGYRYSTGHRNVNALDWNKPADALYIVQHGRDQLGQFFPDYFNDSENAELPAEEFHRVEEGANLGWPYSYYDHRKQERMVMPEYGGDGIKISKTGQKPLLGFPGHWAPNDLLFITDDPALGVLKGGALIAFHGSWNRSPLPQAGYRVAFVPMTEQGALKGQWITFADGFAGNQDLQSPGEAKFRPMGLAQGGDGSIYITSMVGGRIWKVTKNRPAP